MKIEEPDMGVVIEAWRCTAEREREGPVPCSICTHACHGPASTVAMSRREEEASLPPRAAAGLLEGGSVLEK